MLTSRLVVVPSLMFAVLGIGGCVNREDVSAIINADAEKRKHEHNVTMDALGILNSQDRENLKVMADLASKMITQGEKIDALGLIISSLVTQSPDAQRKQAVDDIAGARAAAISLKESLQISQKQFDELAAKQLANLSSLEAAFAKAVGEIQQQANTLLVVEAKKTSAAAEASLKQFEVIAQKIAQRRQDLMMLSRALSKKSLSENDHEGARRFLLNAAYQDPSAIEPIEDYVSLILNDKNSTIDDLFSARQLVSGAELTVSGDKVHSLSDLLVQLDAKEIALAEVQEQNLKDVASAALLKWAETSKADYDSIAESTANIGDRLVLLQSLTTGIGGDATSEPAQKAMAQIATEAGVWERSIRISSAIDQIIDIMARGTDPASNQAPLTLAATETLLTGTYIEGRNGLPEKVTVRILAAQQLVRSFSDTMQKTNVNGTIARLDERIRAADTESKKQLSAAGPNPSQPTSGLGARERAVRALASVTQEAQMLTASISDKDFRAKAEAYLEGLTQAIQAHRRAQYGDYQRWATGCLQEAFKRYKKDTRTDEADAVDAFNIGEYARIDQALLSPEVSHIYGQIWAKLSAEVKDTKLLLELERRMTNISSKVRLENF